MAQSHRAPKQWPLGTDETVNSFESWLQNFIYTLSLDENFSIYLVDGAKWSKSKGNPARGFVDDTTGAKTTAAQKVVNLNLMLGQIAYAGSKIAHH